MMNNGTRKAGISSSGNWDIGGVVASPGASVAKLLLNVPVETATTRSKIPSRFQTTNNRLAAKPGWRISAIATQGAVRPMAMSPNPAGQAKPPGKTPYTYSAMKPNPANRHAWTAVSRGKSPAMTRPRKDGNSQNATRKSRRGTTTPSPIGSGGVPAGAKNIPPAPRTTTAA